MVRFLIRVSISPEKANTKLISSFLKFRRAMSRHTREGFVVNQSAFVLPHDSAALDPKIKRALTICNLFVNHRLPIDRIARLLDQNRGTVIAELINQNIIADRRQGLLGAPEGKERRLAVLLKNRD
jgi:hypothetical protein